MDYKSISAGELANLLEVQRSNISHILNGRNMPGATFIEKFLLCFPDLNARWLLTGQGEMTSETEPERKLASEPAPVAQKEVIKPVIKEQKETESEIVKKEKPVSKVVLLFEDGTFIDYSKR